MSNLGERLQRELDNQGLTQESLANLVGVSQNAISLIINGSTKKPRNLLEIAEALGVEAMWLKTGEGSKYPNGQKAEVNLLQAYEDERARFRVDVYDFELAAGSGAINGDFPDVVRSIWLTEEGIGRLLGRKSAKGVNIFKVPTDSMQPTIHSRDLVFIDTTIRQYQGEGVYAFRLNGEDYIKRLQRQPNGIICALSDNPLYPPFDIEHPLFETAEVLGKFICVVPLNPLFL